MYDAKGRGGDRAAFASSSLTAAVDERLAIEQRLWSGLDQGDFELHFQPVVDLGRGRITGGEALLRWRDGGELISAAQMIPIAEETGLIVEIGRWVVWSALAQLEEWRTAGLTDLTVSVNVSPAQFFRGDIVATFRNALEAVNVPPEQIVVELTESAISGDLEFVVSTLKELKAMGLTIAIDDFGTGHSSLSHLVALPVDVLKIDRTFVAGLPATRARRPSSTPSSRWRDICTCAWSPRASRTSSSCASCASWVAMPVRATCSVRRSAPTNSHSTPANQSQPPPPPRPLSPRPPAPRPRPATAQAADPRCPAPRSHP